MASDNNCFSGASASHEGYMELSWKHVGYFRRRQLSACDGRRNYWLMAKNLAH